MASHTRNRTLVLIASLAVAVTAAAPAAWLLRGDGAPAAAALGAAVPHTAVDAAIVATAIDAFAGHGLEFGVEPVVSFHDDAAACSGNLGYWTDEAGVDRIRVCWTDDDARVQEILRTQALVHELAHAWVYRNTDAATRDAFVELVAADSWNGAEAAWVDRGTEVAAELVTWAVLDPAVLFVEFAESSCGTWAAGYELLVGATAPAHVGC